MLVAGDRWLAGCVSGGCLEGDVMMRGAHRARDGAVVVTYDSQSEDGEAPKPRKKTRRGSRGGRNRRKKPVAADTNGGRETTPAAEPEPVSDAYVPMSEWIDEVDGR